MRSKLYLLLFTLLFTPALFAQTLFFDLAERDVPAGGERRIVPQRYRTVRLDVAAAELFLQQTPNESVLNASDGSSAAARTAKLPILTLPMPDGGTSRFRLVESSVMADELQAKYPETRCYTGKGLDDPTATLKCDLTPWGFHAMILSSRTGTIFIDPYAHGNRDFYVVYFKKDYQRTDPDALFSCSVNGDEHLTEIKEGGEHGDFQGDCQKRTYRLALACTGEYAGFHGGTKPLVISAMNTTMNRVNGVYERDLAITMKIVAKNDTLIYLSASGDPYANTNGSTMLGQNVTTCNSRIGVANYDIGHVFSTGGGGIASLGSVCGTNKARGVTGSGQPIGDAFDVDYVAHEMGHQFGGPHTFNGTAGSCGGGNINAPTAVEPGSGSTIMAYAGICTGQNVQNNSDDYFHASSLQSIGNYTTTGTGNTCAAKTPSNNNAPTVNAGLDYIVPKSTPFSLTASGNDIDGDTLTYCWEQMDIGAGAIPPAATSTTGAMFRTYDPVSSPTRYFPRLGDLNANINGTWEELPAVARVLKFRVTVRDNNFGAGCTEEDDMTVTVNATAGPLQVTVPNTNVTWLVGEPRTITWNVAGTDLAPVNCANVRLLLSINGGATYPFVLAASVPNTGTADITVPNYTSSLCRMKVEAIGNIFYDISNVNFKIQLPPTPTFLLNASSSTVQVCAGTSASLTLTTNSIGGFTSPVDLTVTGAPVGASLTFDPNPVIPANTSVLTFADFTPAMAGVYSIVVQGTSGAIQQSVPLTLTVLTGLPVGVPVLTSPVNGINGQSDLVSLKWNAVQYNKTYQIEVATNPSFTTLFTTQTSTKDSLLLGALPADVYYWRVRATNDCGVTTFSPVFAFQSGKGLCNQTFSSSDTPKIIDRNSVNTVTSTVNVPLNIATSDINVHIKADHNWVGDLIGTLVSPTGKKARLFDQVGNPSIDEFGCPGKDLELTFDDESPLTPLALDTLCGLLFPSLAGTYQPIESLGALENKTVKGDWKLQLLDTVDQDGGELISWSLSFCFPDSVQQGNLLINKTLAVVDGGQSTVANTHLKMETSGPTALGTFTLLALPQHGSLLLSNVALGIGDVFTQADIDAGLLVYKHNGDTASTDSFRFDVLDKNTQAWLHDVVFNIVILKNTLVVTAVQTKAVSCYNGKGGEITATPSGLSGPYQYSINGGLLQNDSVFTYLQAGTYIIVAVGQFGFEAVTSPITLDNPTAVQPAASVTDDDLAASATGGAGNYEYSLDGTTFQPSALFENLPNGNYTLTVRDANGCTATTTAKVAVNRLVVSAAVSKNIGCFGGSDGSITASVSGGQAPYSYRLNGGTPQLDSMFFGLAPGAYTVEVKDNEGFARMTVTVLVAEPVALSATAIITNDDVTVVAAGGTAPFDYSTNGTIFQIANVLEDLPNGIYTLFVRDANGCTTTVQAIVAVNTMLAMTTVDQQVTCFGGDNGSLTVMVGGGESPYTYSLDGSVFQPSNTFTDLAAGSYAVLVKDNQGFTTTTAAVEVTEPSAVTVTANVALNVITATASGGTGAIEYSLDGGAFQVGHTFPVLASGSYTVTARDANGCTGTFVATVTIPALTVTAIVSQAIWCFGDLGSLTILAEGGIAPYQYRLEGWQYQADNTFTSLTAATYTLFVKDAAGTEVTVPGGMLSQPDSFSVALTVIGNDASLQVTGPTPPYTYELNGEPAAPLGDLANGEYVLVVTDSNGCTKQVIFEINYTILSATAQTSDPDICDEQLNIIVTATGGAAPYEYALNTQIFGSNPVFTNVTEGINTVMVRDVQGETFLVAVNFNLPEALKANIATVGDSIVVTATDGVAPYEYALNGGATQLQPLFGNLATGTYTVVVTDSRGCKVSVTGINIISGIIEPGVAWGLLVAPNPSNGLFRLTIQQAPTTLRAEVLDATGRLMQSLTFEPVNGLFSTELDLSHLPQGMYALRLTDGKQSGAVKLSLVR